MEKTNNKKKPEQKSPNPAPTLATVAVCLFAIVVLQGIAAVTKTEIPIIVYAIIAGILFGIGNVKNLIGGGGKDE